MLSKWIKNILESKRARRVLFVLVFLFVWYFAFSVGADCFAEGAVMDSQTRMTNFNVMASEVIKCLYVILWPLIFVCGIALDNSLVYGTWLHLDAPLWSFWNIMKNIANFTLGGLVLFAILRNLISAVGKGGGDKWSPMNVIKNTLIAGILIQMSWFLVAAVIDVSTVLTYAVGGLPMTVLKTNPSYSNRPVMSLSINAHEDNGIKYDIYYTYGDHKVSDCEIGDDLPISGSYIVGPKIVYLWDSANDTGFYMDTGYCTIGGWPYRYNHMLTGDDAGIYPDIHSFDNESGYVRNSMYTTTLENYTRALTSEKLSSALDSCVVIPVDDLELSSGCKAGRYGPLSLSGDDEFFHGENSENTILYTIDNLIEESKGFVGPLITIYSSLLDIQSFVDDGTSQYIETFISLLFKLVFFILLVAPLIGLAVILVVRIGVLRVLIAASPALILIWVFGDMLGSLKDILGKTFSLGNIVKLIFAPVIITLAISISLIFINAISGSLTRGGGLQREEVLMALGVDADENQKDTYSILGLVDIKLDTTLIGKGKDDLAYFIMFLFATAIIRFFLVAALKMCGPIGESVGKFMDDNFTKMMKNVPIIPLPRGAGRVGLEALSEVPNRLTNKVVNDMKQVSEENMETSFPWLYSGDGRQKLATSIVEKIQKDQISSLTSAQANILAPIFGTRSGSEIVKMVKGMGDEATTFVNNYYTYNAGNSESITKITTEGANIGTEKTSADALKLTQAELDIAVQNDANWISWASGMIGGAVHTKDGVYIVDIIPGTEQNPMYRIVDRDTYETAHFGKPIEKVSQEEFDTRKKENQNNLTTYLGKLSDSDKKLAELENIENDKRTADQKTQLEQLNKFFTDKIREQLDDLGLVDYKFKKEEPQTGNGK